MDFVTPAERQGLIVSVSQVTSYILCPKKYEFRYVTKAEAEHKSSNLVIGIAVHAALAYWYLAHADGVAPDEEEFLTSFHDAFDHEVDGALPVFVAGERTPEDERADGVRVLRAFWETAEVPDKVVAVEQPFCVDVVDPATGAALEEQLIGYIDGVIEDDGTRILLEHKTAARRWPQDRLDFDLQVGTYLAVSNADAVRVQLLLKTKQAQVVSHHLTRTEQQKVEALEVLCRVLDGIRGGAFFKNRGWACKACNFRRQCS